MRNKELRNYTALRIYKRGYDQEIPIFMLGVRRLTYHEFRLVYIGHKTIKYIAWGYLKLITYFKAPPVFARKRSAYQKLSKRYKERNYKIATVCYEYLQNTFQTPLPLSAQCPKPSKVSSIFLICEAILHKYTSP